MAEGTPLRIVMAPKTKRALALGLAVEAYADYSDVEKAEGLDPGRWADDPDFHADQVIKVAEKFRGFLEAGEGD